MNKKNRKIIIAALIFALITAIAVLVFLIISSNSAKNDYDYLDAKEIDLSKSDGEVVIEDGGKYILTGETKNSINITSRDQVTLYLNNITINAAASTFKSSSEKLVISPLDNTRNTLTKSEGKDPLILADGDFEVTAEGGVLILDNSSNPSGKCISAKKFYMNPGMKITYKNCKLDGLELEKR